jgi:putative ABC transport system substrate-binding protein
MMKRREFIAGAVSAAAMPLLVRAQQAMPVIGYFDSAALVPARVAAFRRGLAEGGIIEGQNVAIEFRAAAGRYEQLSTLAAELVNRPVNLILGGGLPTTQAAKAATTTIPIVFVMGADPVKLGIVASLNQPGGNITGVSQLFGGLGAKRLELMRELVPGAASVAVLSNPRNPNAASHLQEVTFAARTVGQRIEVFEASTEAAIDAAFARIAEQRAAALLVADDPLFTVRREQVVALAARHALPAIHYSQEFAAVGGLISYGSSASDNYRLAGVYAARILKGTRPADLPVLLPTKFEIAINLKTARTLGLAIPPTLLARADEVIE